MAQKRFSISELARYMTSSASAQRTIIRQNKYPDEESSARTKYYREARNIIASFHRRDKGVFWLIERATRLASSADAESNRRRRTRLNHNARAVRQYAQHFGDVEYEVLTPVKLKLRHRDVMISIAPDLHVMHSNREKIVKLDYTKDPASTGEVKIVCQAMLEASVQSGLELGSAGVLFVDISSGVSHRGARMGARMRKDIKAACESISAIWDSL